MFETLVISSSRFLYINFTIYLSDNNILNLEKLISNEKITENIYK